MTLFESFEQVAGERPDQTAISYHREPHTGVVLTWEAVVDRSRHIAETLRTRGVGSGQRCAVVMADHPDIVPTVLAVWLRGAIVIPIDGQWGGQLTRSVLMLGDAEFILDVAQGICTRRWASLEDKPELPADTAMISYTSGSTSDPKGVVLTHGQLHHAYVAGRRAVEKLLTRLPSRFAVTMRLSGLGILGMNYLWPAVMGMSVAVLPELTLRSVRRYWTDLRASGAGLTYLVPALVELLNRAAIDGPADQPAPEVVCLCAGAPLSASAQTRFQQQFRAILLNVYGLTEVSFAAFFGDRDAAGRGTPSIGRPATVRARLRGADGDVVDGGGEGEVELSGPAVSSGYYGNSAGTAALLRDGWVRTGDLARRDAEGRYWIVGRRKDVVLKGGFTVYLHEIEEAAGLLPGVLECAAVRLDFPTGEDIGLLVRPDPASVEPVLPTEVQRELATRLGRQRAPSRVIVTTDPLPRLGQEKIDRREVLACWQRITSS